MTISGVASGAGPPAVSLPLHESVSSPILPPAQVSALWPLPAILSFSIAFNVVCVPLAVVTQTAAFLPG